MLERVRLQPAAGQIEREMPTLAEPLPHQPQPWPGARFESNMTLTPTWHWIVSSLEERREKRWL
jgi:hypothetical protein